MRGYKKVILEHAKKSGRDDTSSSARPGKGPTRMACVSLLSSSVRAAGLTFLPCSKVLEEEGQVRIVDCQVQV